MANSSSQPQGVVGRAMAIVIATAFAIGCSVTLLWLAMRGALALGGMLASGGPYEIAHPAPGWIWVFPVAFIVLIVAMQSSKGLSDRYDTPSLMLLAWSSLFLSMGWNFLEFGLRAPGTGGLAIGWLVSAATFAIMGGGGLYVFFVARATNVKMDREKAEKTGGSPIPPGFRAYQVATAIALAAGVAAGWAVFGLLGA